MNYEHRYTYQFTHLTRIIPEGLQCNTATGLQNRILAVGLVFNQIGAKAGIKKFYDKDLKALIGKCKQLDNKKAVKPRGMKDLTELKRNKALQSITPVKEKCCGKIKGSTSRQWLRPTLSFSRCRHIYRNRRKGRMSCDNCLY